MGRVCVFSLSSTDVIVDVMGEIGVLFQGRAPVRVVEHGS